MTHHWQAEKRWQKFKREFSQYASLEGEKRFKLKWTDRYPCLNDNTGETSFDAHYIYHPAWAARILAKTHPTCHVDISSALNFCTLVSAFLPIWFYDYRPANLNLSGLSSESADLLSLPFENNSVLSLSCMHVVEHIGLGRYGDPLDPTGDLKSIAELKRVLAPGGNLLFVTPVGGEAKIMFNAHRVYRFDQISAYFKDLTLVNFALVTDSGMFIDQASEADANNQGYGCGCWWFNK